MSSVPISHSNKNTMTLPEDIMEGLDAAMNDPTVRHIDLAAECALAVIRLLQECETIDEHVWQTVNRAAKAVVDVNRFSISESAVAPRLTIDEKGRKLANVLNNLDLFCKHSLSQGEVIITPKITHFFDGINKELNDISMLQTDARPAATHIGSDTTPSGSLAPSLPRVAAIGRQMAMVMGSGSISKTTIIMIDSAPRNAVTIPRTSPRAGNDMQNSPLKILATGDQVVVMNSGNDCTLTRYLPGKIRSRKLSASKPSEV